MSSTEQPLVRISTDLASFAQFTPPGKRAVANIPASDGPAFTNSLIDQGLFQDATRAIPYFLTNRQACWWASLCIWHSLAAKLSNAERKALDGCVRWIVDPSLEHRRAAKELAEAAGTTTAPGCLGKAISVADCLPPGAPRFPTPKPFLTARLCSMTTLACYFAGGRKAEHRQAFALIGSELIQGRQHWELPSSAASRSRLGLQSAKGNS